MRVREREYEEGNVKVVGQNDCNTQVRKKRGKKRRERRAFCGHFVTISILILIMVPDL